MTLARITLWRLVNFQWAMSNRRAWPPSGSNADLTPLHAFQRLIPNAFSRISNFENSLRPYFIIFLPSPSLKTFVRMFTIRSCEFVTLAFRTFEKKILKDVHLFFSPLESKFNFLIIFTISWRNCKENFKLASGRFFSFHNYFSHFPKSHRNALKSCLKNLALKLFSNQIYVCLESHRILLATKRKERKKTVTMVERDRAQCHSTRSRPGQEQEAS